MQDTLICINHPQRETLIRCNRCGEPICSSCAVQTPVGYRCVDCVEVIQSRRLSDWQAAHGVARRRSPGRRRWIAAMAGFVPVALVATLLVMVPAQADTTGSLCDTRPAVCATVLDLRADLADLGDDAMAWVLSMTDSHARRLDRAAAQARQGDLAGAVDTYTQALATGDLTPTQTVAALEGRAAAAQRRGDMNAAIDDLTAVVALAADADLSVAALADTLARRAALYAELEDWPTALADLDRALTLTPGDALLLAQRGDIHLELGQFEAAIADLKAGMEADIAADAARLDAQADLVNAYSKLTEKLRKLQLHDQAVEHLNEALTLPHLDQRQRAALLADRGFLYLELNDYRAARSDLDRAIDLAPESDGAWGVRAQLNSKEERYDEAIADAAETLRLCRAATQITRTSADCWFAYFVRGHAYLGNGASALAVEDFTMALKHTGHNHPHSDAIYYNRATAYTDMGDPTAAMADFDAAIEAAMAQGNLRLLADAYGGRAAVLRNQGQLRAAREDVVRATALRDQLN